MPRTDRTAPTTIKKSRQHLQALKGAWKTPRKWPVRTYIRRTNPRISVIKNPQITTSTYYTVQYPASTTDYGSIHSNYSGNCQRHDTYILDRRRGDVRSELRRRHVASVITTTIYIQICMYKYSCVRKYLRRRETTSSAGTPADTSIRPSQFTFYKNNLSYTTLTLCIPTVGGLRCRRTVSENVW